MENTFRKIQEELFVQLATAIQLEHATLPPYLYAYWSLKNLDSPMARSLLEVIKEEMLHMSLVCNILNAIGGSPSFNHKTFIPKYPTALPAHDMMHDPFIVGLHKMGLLALVTFLHIELPRDLGLPPDDDPEVGTIGEFYARIIENINQLPDQAFQHGKQLGSQFSPYQAGVLFEVYSRADAIRAINEIMEQGEGFSFANNTAAASEVSHFHRYLEMYREIGGRGSIHKGHFNHLDLQNTLDQSVYQAFQQEVKNVVSNPLENNGTSASAYFQNMKFNAIYSRMLDALTEGFNLTNPSIEEAIKLMFALTRPALEIMSIPVNPGDLSQGYCGPTFEYLSVQERRY